MWFCPSDTYIRSLIQESSNFIEYNGLQQSKKELGFDVTYGSGNSRLCK